MPFCRCPICHRIFHVDMAMPIDERRMRNFPGHDSNVPASVTCLDCFAKPNLTDATSSTTGVDREPPK